MALTGNTRHSESVSESIFDYSRGKSTTFWEKTVCRPDCIFRMLWDVFAYVFLMVQIMHIPFEIAFVEGTDKKFWHSWNSFIVMIDIFWILDIALNFWTGYYDKVTGHLELRPHVVIPRYLRRWFVVDLISTMHAIVQWVAVSAHGGSSPESMMFLNLTKLVKIFRTLRLLRLLKLGDQILRLEMKMNSSILSSMLGLMKLMVLPMVFSHVTSCILWSIGRSNLEDGGPETSWIAAGLSGDNPVAEYTLTQQYTCAIYFAVTVMSTVGFGDITARSQNERYCLTVIMFFTSAIVGVVVNGISKVFAKMTERGEGTRESLKQASIYMNTYAVPMNIQARVKQYLELTFQSQERLDVKTALRDWMKSSGHLYDELNLAITGKCLMKHRLLSRVPTALLAKICDICEALFRPPGNLLIASGQPLSQMIYIRSGTVEITKAQEDDTLGEGFRKPHEEQSRQHGLTISFEHVSSGRKRGKTRQTLTGLILGMQHNDRSNSNRVTLTVGDFLGEMQLFLDTKPHVTQAVCSSFSELIGLDFTKFRRLLLEVNPLLSATLSIYAAVILDLPDKLLEVMDMNDIDAEDQLVGGEVALHECARRGAVQCIKALINELQADPNVRSEAGKTPLEVAAAASQPHAVKTLLLHGAQFAATVDLRPGSQAEATAEASWCLERIAAAGKDKVTYEEFVETLSTNGVDVDAIEQVKEGNLRKLYEEQVAGLCTCMACPDGTMKRYLQVVRAKLIVRRDGKTKVLCEAETTGGLSADADGNLKVPARKMKRGKAVETLETLLSSALGLSVDWQRQHLARGREKVFHEEKESSSFPGLPCVYFLHEVPLLVREPDHPDCALIGLPECTAFQREEFDDRFGQRQHIFVWQLVSDNEEHWAAAKRHSRHSDQATTSLCLDDNASPDEER